MNTHYNVDPSWALIFKDLGFDQRRVLRRANLPDDLLTRCMQRIDAEAYNALWKSMEIESGEQNLPLMLAELLTVEAFSAPIFAAICCNNLLEAATRLSTYKPLIGPMMLEVTSQRHHITIAFKWPENIEVPHSLGMSELTFWVAFARIATRERLIPAKVQVAAMMPNPKDYECYLGVALTPSNTWSISFRKDDAYKQFMTANESMWQFFEPELKRQLSSLTEEVSFGDRVEGALLELLPTGEASIEQVSKRLGVSKRTLQRRLTNEQTNYQAILNETRKTLATHYLKSSHLPTAEISFLLGYDDPNSFYRAFHHWTGQTPESIRHH